MTKKKKNSLNWIEIKNSGGFKMLEVCTSIVLFAIILYYSTILFNYLFSVKPV